MKRERDHHDRGVDTSLIGEEDKGRQTPSRAPVSEPEPKSGQLTQSGPWRANGMVAALEWSGIQERAS
jgi:hypothetical protein